MEQLSQYTGLVGVGLVLVGWFVIYRNARKIATRGESKALIDDVIGILADIEDLAVNYWLSGRRNRIESEEFTLLFNAKLLTLNSRLEILKKRKLNTDVVDLAKISESITYQCEDVDTFPSNERRSRVQVFLDELNNANQDLYQEFQRLHKPVY